MGRYVRQTWIPPLRPGQRGPASPGKRSTAIDEYEAFVPDAVADLDVDALVSHRTQEAIHRAESAIATLNDSGTDIGIIDTAMRSVRRSEAVALMEAEGRGDDPELLEVVDRTAANPHEVELAVGRCVELLNAAMERDGQITVETICAAHAIAAAEHRPGGGAPGELRSDPVWIGSREGLAHAPTPLTASYVGPPADMVPELLEDLSAFTARRDLSAVVQAAVVHGQFMTIHPFLDGNGRVGRSLMHPVFRASGTTPRIVPPVGLEFGLNFDAYIVGLHRSYQADDLDTWIALVAGATAVAAEDALDLGQRLARAERSWMKSVRKRKRKRRSNLARLRRSI